MTALCKLESIAHILNILIIYKYISIIITAFVIDSFFPSKRKKQLESLLEHANVLVWKTVR